MGQSCQAQNTKGAVNKVKKAENISAGRNLLVLVQRPFQFYLFVKWKISYKYYEAMGPGNQFALKT